MVWKKNSVAVSPLKKLFATKPFAAGNRLFASKCGSVLIYQKQKTRKRKDKFIVQAHIYSTRHHYGTLVWGQAEVLILINILTGGSSKKQPTSKNKFKTQWAMCVLFAH